MKERRKWKRYPIAYPIEFREGHVTNAPELLDVSSGGIAFTSPEKLDQDDKVELFLFMKKKRVHLQAKVVHAMTRDGERFFIGAKLVDIPDDFINLLHREMDEIKELHRHKKNHTEDTPSFSDASTEYIRKSFIT